MLDCWTGDLGLALGVTLTEYLKALHSFRVPEAVMESFLVTRHHSPTCGHRGDAEKHVPALINSQSLWGGGG